MSISAASNKFSSFAGVLRSSPLAAKLQKNNWRDLVFTAILLLAFLTLAVPEAFTHVAWRDEWQAWLIAKYTPSPLATWRWVTYRGEGTPAMWHLLLWPLAHAGFGISSMRLTHLSASALGVAIVAQWAPWPRLHKVLFAFGYFIFYEYTAISRCYSLAVPLTMAAAALLASPQRRPLILGLVLALLAQVSTHGAALAGVFSVVAVTDAFLRRRSVNPGAAWRWVCGGLLVAAGIGLTLYAAWASMQNRSDMDFLSSLTPSQRIANGLGALWIAFCPLPFPVLNGWNTSLLQPWPWLQAGLGVAVTIVLAVLLLRSWSAFGLFVLGALILAGVGACWPGNLRSHGHAFLLLMASLWLVESRSEQNVSSSRVIQWMQKSAAWRPTVITILLTVQIVAAAISAVREQVIPFSGSAQVAELIQSQGLSNLPVIGDCEFAAVAVAGYLNHPIFYADRQELGTYGILGHRRIVTITPSGELMAFARSVMHSNQSDVVLVVNYPIRVSGSSADFVGTTGPCIVDGEQFWIVRLHAIQTHN